MLVGLGKYATNGSPPLLRVLLDSFLVTGSLALISLAYGGMFGGADTTLALVVVSLLYSFAVGSGAGAPSLSRLLWTWALSVLAFLLLGALIGYIAHLRRDVFFTWAMLVPFLVYGGRLVLPFAAPRIPEVDAHRTAVLVGRSPLGRSLGEQFDAISRLGRKVVGLFDDRSKERLGAPDASLQGRLADLPQFVKENGVGAVFIALPNLSQARLLTLLDELRDTTASIYLVLDIFHGDLIQARLDVINGILLLAVCESPHHGASGRVKRLFDTTLAFTILVLTCPVMLAIAVGVRCSSPGAIIFRQRRYGLDGQEITVYKFRTMRVMEDGADIPQARKNDPRITKFGALLRRTSLDELPQLINVLQGRMSIVGPRPHAAAHNEMYRKLIKGYMVRHKVKPGITGLAQVSGCRGETDSVEKMQKRIEYDLAYLRDWSLALDLKIIFRTVGVLLKRDENAH